MGSDKNIGIYSMKGNLIRLLKCEYNTHSLTLHNNLIYVCCGDDSVFHCILILTLYGKTVLKIGDKQSNDDGKFNDPKDIVVNDDFI